MTHSQTGTLFESLDILLEKERHALLAGDLGEISSILAEKETFLDRLSALKGPQTETLAPLRDKVSRNQVLLDSALQGIREVADRMNALRQA
ncbi:hypothetical protein SAMN05444000_12223 [Shimia gijangensis]|uniref:FlgN protein n=1 Tax=Shimia gijangensis TaxID=1470563 RepID=A0A1M6QK33_9RHOB|nr:hypothetical protein [Shimia gijangensis]SHK20639.1 hypothetical protein SAMN05444000_12223 [Shimia gijangensis]